MVTAAVELSVCVGLMLPNFYSHAAPKYVCIACLVLVTNVACVSMASNVLKASICVANLLESNYLNCCSPTLYTLYIFTYFRTEKIAYLQDTVSVSVCLKLACNK